MKRLRHMYPLCIVLLLSLSIHGYARTINSHQKDCTAPCCETVESPAGSYIEYLCTVEEVQCAVRMNITCFHTTENGVESCTCPTQLVWSTPEFLCVYPRPGGEECQDGWHENELCTLEYDQVITNMKAQAEAAVWQCISGLPSYFECTLEWVPIRIQ